MNLFSSCTENRSACSCLLNPCYVAEGCVKHPVQCCILMLLYANRNIQQGGLRIDLH